MYQRGEDQNRQTGFWGMIKSVTSTQTGSESILSNVMVFSIYNCMYKYVYVCKCLYKYICIHKYVYVCTHNDSSVQYFGLNHLYCRPLLNPAGSRCSGRTQSTTLSRDCGPAGHQGNVQKNMLILLRSGFFGCRFCSCFSNDLQFL